MTYDKCSSTGHISQNFRQDQKKTYIQPRAHTHPPEDKSRARVGKKIVHPKRKIFVTCDKICRTKRRAAGTKAAWLLTFIETYNYKSPGNVINGLGDMEPIAFRVMIHRKKLKKKIEKHFSCPRNKWAKICVCPCMLDLNNKNSPTIFF